MHNLTRRRKRTKHVELAEIRVELLEARALLSGTTTPNERGGTCAVETHNRIEGEINAAISNEADTDPDNDVRLLFIGDSITERWRSDTSHTSCGSFNLNQTGAVAFEQYFDEYTGDPGPSDDTYINMGIGGDRTQDVLWRLGDYDLQNITPDVAVLKVGTNNLCHTPQGIDCADGGDHPLDTTNADGTTTPGTVSGIIENAKFLRDELGKDTTSGANTQVLLLGVLPRKRELHEHDLAQWIEDTNAELESFAAGEDRIHFVDVGGLFLDGGKEEHLDPNGIPLEESKRVTFDGLHLNEHGYEMYAATIAPIIEGLMADGPRTEQVIEGTNSSGIVRLRYTPQGYEYNKTYADPNAWMQTNKHHVRVDAKDGRIRIEGDAGDDEVILGGDSLYMIGAGRTVYATNASIKTVFGGGGSDTATIFDSVENDTFVVKGSEGRGYIANAPLTYSDAREFEEIRAFSTHGDDAAQFYDSAGDDDYVATPTHAYLKKNDNSFHHSAERFEETYAYATLGGADKAWFYGSTGDDDFFSVPANDVAYMRNDPVHNPDTVFYNHATGFETSAAYSRGGVDEALFYDSVGNDYFIAKPRFSKSYMTDVGTYHSEANGFARSYAYSSNGGNDQAQFYLSLIHI